MGRLIAALLLFCTSTVIAAQDLSSTPTITLERTGCFGSCPIYKVSIFADGSVVYEGKEYVRVKGTQRANIGPDAVKTLVQRFRDIGYWELENHYSSIKNPDGTQTLVTDLPTTTTSLHVDGKLKEVVDYVGAPQKLKDLEKKIDIAARTRHWIGIDAASVREQARKGWDVNSDDARRLLLDAVRTGDAETVQAFVEARADVNALIGNVYFLQLANGTEVVRLLINAGANVNASTEYFGTPLSSAAERGDVDSVTLLIKAGAKIDGRNADGMTPLMVAAAHGNPEAVQALLLAGAQSDTRDKNGRGALFHARDGLRRQNDLEKHPEPFAEAMPEFRDKYKHVQELLTAAGATDNLPVAP